jgi:hypothetical protein
MKNRGHIFFVLILCTACTYVLEPKPVDQLTDDIVLNEPQDVPNVEIGLYNAFRDVMPSTIIAGDMTSDMLIQSPKGTFAQYKELGTKIITSTNSSIAKLWYSIYHTIYIANFILERLPDVSGVKAAERKRVMATAHFLRGYSYFIALNTYGRVPKVVTTLINDNRNIARASEQEIAQLISEDLNFALGVLTAEPTDPGYLSDYAVRAALAKVALYSKDWAMAESYASQVIGSNKYVLDADFTDVVHKDFPTESIFEVAFTVFDDPGTDGELGLNDLFKGRREIIPSNQIIFALDSKEAGTRNLSILFDTKNLNGTDNGWSVDKYGTKDEGNNIFVFRLAEMYLIRAEARAQQGKISGVNGAIADINVLRQRAKAPTISSATQNQMIQLIEDERRYELAFEGHRWYDLVRTGRAAQVMPVFNTNWRTRFEKWPIPQREIQNNPGLADDQNPGY